MNTDSTSPPRISLTPDFEMRTTAGVHIGGDPRIVNGYIEKTPDGEATVKRPGFLVQFRSAAVDAILGGTGIFVWKRPTLSGRDFFTVVNGKLFLNGVNLLGAVGNQITTQRWTFNSTQGGLPKLVMQNGTRVHTYNGNVLQLNVVSSINFVPGSAYLDGTLYMADKNNLYGSGLNDPTTWNPLNVIKPQQEPDEIVYVIKQHQYVMVLKEWTTEFFWDAGNPVGSPLKSAQGASLDFGCAAPGSVQQLEDTVIWLAASKNSAGFSIMAMQNLQPQTISTQSVERALVGVQSFASFLSSWAVRINGHRLYGINLPTGTLVYDFTTQKWHQWTYNGGQFPNAPLPFRDAVVLPGTEGAFFQHNDGSVYRCTPTATMDDGAPIPVDIYGRQWDGGTRRRKYLQRLEALGDQEGMHTAQLRWSEDDFQTWSNYRPIDLNQKRPFIEDLGTFYRRAFHLHYDAPTAFRIRDLECTNILLGAE